MAMPDHLVLVRHGESEGNFVRDAHKHGDDTYLTQEFRDRPGHEWRLTPAGVEQAKATGEWIQKYILDAYGLNCFDQYHYSPHRRTRETAALLGLPAASWTLNRLLREREWGELAPLTRSEHEEKFPDNYKWQQSDPLHWAPPGGESISQVADNRVREVFDSLHRAHDEKGEKAFVLVTHGEFMWASRLVLDYMFNEDYMAAESDPTQKIHNCQVLHYTRISPEDGSRASYLRWRRSICAWQEPNDDGRWEESGRLKLSNEELLEQVEQLPRLFDN